MKRILTVALLLTAIAFLISLVYKPLSVPSLVEEKSGPRVHTVVLAERTVFVDVADTPEKRSVGLSGREELAPDEGMLFVFPEDGMHAFWMKDMGFSIDILWISREGLVVDMQQKVSPETYPAAYVPRKEARYVLELPSGWIERYTVGLGDVVQL
ncbi:hypothetical protein A3B35_03630 [Candidatus Kaiserbacteria bacterium RIFCSPLOWO2_01_FULL_54_24]|uniref:DUF192 domain-containing protein n=1 Tax=Candidatus Kaiserbacteria bacterium RIFCSPLOWO2_01_FULL_54_24 TaxID=1798515 RepID=A0A1F6EV72_9BACT|nr:MAG: hypothetical protein A3B35_03630 [Candidatus Kaiserbacteria bacterium RIFCSPLOWO2_01_FULL_54_24]